MDGTCSETIKDAISRSPGGLFVQTTVLVLISGRCLNA
jgi:hypothetical protein